MEVMYLLVVIGIVTAAIIVWIFLWSVKSGQFDDLDGPAYRILLDRDVAADTSDSKNTRSP